MWACARLHGGFRVWDKEDDGWIAIRRGEGTEYEVGGVEKGWRIGERAEQSQWRDIRTASDAPTDISTISD